MNCPHKSELAAWKNANEYIYFIDLASFFIYDGKFFASKINENLFSCFMVDLKTASDFAAPDVIMIVKLRMLITVWMFFKIICP
jgi:hypothetical protein